MGTQFLSSLYVRCSVLLNYHKKKKLKNYTKKKEEEVKKYATNCHTMLTIRIVKIFIVICFYVFNRVGCYCFDSTMVVDKPNRQYIAYPVTETPKVPLIFHSDECNANFPLSFQFVAPTMSYHYTCPLTSLPDLRKRYGTRKSLWGEWTSYETRQFYKMQLPKALQIDGALGLSLEERARLASDARHALRIYSRERCYLPGRLFSRIYDGFRHLHYFGSWSPEGMTWAEVKQKYSKEARMVLGKEASEHDIIVYVYQRIVQKSCSTNLLIDQLAEKSHVKRYDTLFLTPPTIDRNDWNVTSIWEKVNLFVKSIVYRSKD